MSGRPRGQPRKKARKNQTKSTIDNSNTLTPDNPLQASSQAAAPHKNPSWKGQGHNGSMSDFKSDLEPGDEIDEECEGDEFSDLDDEDFGARLAEMAG